MYFPNKIEVYRTYQSIIKHIQIANHNKVVQLVNKTHHPNPSNRDPQYKQNHTKSPSNPKKQEIPNYKFKPILLLVYLKHSCIQAPFNLKRKKSINTSILNLFKVEPLIVPPTHRDPLGLLNLLPQHHFRQVLQPHIAKLDHSVVSRQGAKINSGGHRQPIILNQPLDIDVNTYNHERVDRVVEEVEERLGDVRGVGELEDEASAANAGLKNGGGVVVETVIGSPLDVQADDEAVESRMMDGCDR
ncbi:unnamed protein product [Camellia sinensis]